MFDDHYFCGAHFYRHHFFEPAIIRKNTFAFVSLRGIISIVNQTIILKCYLFGEFDYKHKWERPALDPKCASAPKPAFFMVFSLQQLCVGDYHNLTRQVSRLPSQTHGGHLMRSTLRQGRDR